MQLRPYQKELVDHIWSGLFTKKTQLVVSPCGSGKTECFIALCERALKSKPDIKILILLNKVLLVEQTVRRLSKVIENVGTYCGSLNEKTINNVTVASIQSIKNVDIGTVNLIILDEAHNVSVKEDTNYGIFLNKIDHEKIKIVGFTATPYRESSPIYGEKEFFKKIDYEIKIEFLLSEGFLVPPVLKASNHEFDTSKLKIVAGDFDKKELSQMTEDHEKASVQVKDAISRIGDRKKIAWACATIRHAEIVFSLLDDAVIIHSNMGDKDQEHSMNRFIHGGAKHVVFVSMLSEGIDIPIIDALVFLRPTRSIARYIQTVGRVMRPSNNKSSALILDYGQVVKNCGPITAPFIRRKGARRSSDPSMKVCEKCFSVMLSTKIECPDCGFEFFPKKKELPRLDNKPTQSINILGTSQIIEMACSFVKIKKHKSTNGNDCLMITYYSDGLIPETISEYFAWNNDWSVSRAYQRLTSLGCTIVDKLDDQIKESPSKSPISIFYKYDGKYKKIVSLKFN